MLIKLYDLPAGRTAGSVRASDAHVVRKPIGTEADAVVAWVGEHFGARWGSEARMALTNRPVSLFVAVHASEPIGFACYDATARGYVGPIGVLPQARGTGIGAALLRAALEDMRAAGYGYAVAGAVGASEFFRSVAGAVEIPSSSPGLYAGLVKTAP